MDKLEGTFVQIYDLDVWGNDEEGFEVNDVIKGDIFEVPSDYTDRDLFRLLKDQGFLPQNTKFGNLNFIWSEGLVEIFDSESNEPIWQFWDIDSDDALWNAKNGTNVFNMDGGRLLTYADGTFEFGGL